MFTLGAVFILAFLGLSKSASHDAGSDHFEAALQDVMEHIVRNRRGLTWIDTTKKKPLSKGEIQMIVDTHNSYRSAIKPTATDMIEVTWDKDIAKFAQTHLNKCTGKHNPNRKLDPWGSMGENMYFMQGKSYSPDQAMGMWWNEGKNFEISTVTCKKGGCNHFKAMAWAKTEKIGCGVKTCDAFTENKGLAKPTTIMLCSYSKAVYKGAKPYTVGASCSACPGNFPKCRHNLCVTQAMLDSGEGFNGNISAIGDIPDAGDDGDNGDNDDAVAVSASYFVCLLLLPLAILLK